MPAIVADIERRLDSIESAARKAGDVLVQMQAGDLDVSTKSNARDLVTKADVTSEQILIEHIKNHFPGDSILAEESGTVEPVNNSSGKSADGEFFTWVLDPVDGTVNYAHGLPLYAVSCGLLYGTVESAQPVGGLILHPALRNTYRAVQGNGATKNNKPISVSAETELAKSLVVTGFPYNRVEMLDTLVGAIREVLQNSRGIRRTGSACIDLCWLAEGIFDAHYEFNLKSWDTTAAQCILEEAGGKMTDLTGNRYESFKPAMTMVASNGNIHEELLKTLNGK